MLAEWAYWAIVLTGLFWGNFLAYCMKKEHIEDRNKVAAVGHRQKEKEFSLDSGGR